MSDHDEREEPTVKKRIVCNAPGDRCTGCLHYQGKADKCEWPPQVPAQPDASLKASLQRDAAFMRRAQGAEKAADELRQEIRRKRALAQRLDASHDECCQREASAVQRAEAAEAELAKMRAEREGMVLVPKVPTIAGSFYEAGYLLIPIEQVRLLAAAYRAMLAASQPPAENEES